jgi:hypothetical protein
LPVEEAASEPEPDLAFTAMSTEAFAVPVTTIAPEPPIIEAPPAPPVITARAWHKPEPEPQPQPRPDLEPEPVPAVAPAARPLPRIAVIPACPDFGQARAKANDLVAVLHKRGKRVALIDAGSGQRSATSGISDLAAGRAGFAEVIQPDETGALASIGWGRRASVDLDAEPVRILLLALRELYDAVIVITGRSEADQPRALLAMPDVVALDQSGPAPMALRRAAASRHW